MRIEQIADRIASWVILYNDKEKAFGRHVTKENLMYSLINSMNNMSIIVLIVLLGVLLNDLKLLIQITCLFGIFRFFTGGLHLTTPLQCIVVSTFIILLARYLPLPGILPILLCFMTLGLTLRFAPASVSKHSIPLTAKRTILFKIIACLIVITTSLFQNDHLITVMFLQSLTLIHYKTEGRCRRVESKAIHR
ncbi:accessory gene regulator B family protein [Paenibacillus xylanilyticus]|uniref:Accessory regulator AgrB n=1 Tax=Paenibacillus xylanilyticus TaxID=248903 RepID=A0A7Y6BVD4_9BACL|nr:accessory gene regulator B family protein [Paenibacillus xylanilyticus]NUU74644.1 hypothetical protein [Paenibacillus xylanilyticus]